MKHRSEIGWLGEQAVDQANVAGSGGRLVPWIPLIDAHGIDRAYSWEGVGMPTFVQVKTSAAPDREGRHHWLVRADAIPAYSRFALVLSIFDRASGRSADVYWCLDARAIRRLGQRSYNSALRADVYQLDASPTHMDRLAPYRHTRSTLWRCFAASLELASHGPLTFPTLHVDQGGVFEFAVIERLLAANHKDLLIFRPAFDVHGRDLLVQLIRSGGALYLQIKGSAIVGTHGLIRFDIARSTFVAADDFWLALLLWNRREDALSPECWLIPSREVQRRAARQRARRYLEIYTHIDPDRDEWFSHRHPVKDIATVVRTALAELRLAA
jgi:hypothetical protein